MTVAELIKKLSQFPKNREVVFNGSGQAREFSFVDSVRIDDEGSIFNDDEKQIKGTRLAVALVED